MFGVENTADVKNLRVQESISKNATIIIEVEKFKYYHGTSTVFIDSIKKTGLGGINPNYDLKTLDLLRYLLKEAENLIPDNLYLKNNRSSIVAMANQRTIEAKLPNGKVQLFYFRHDSIYVALSLQRAIVYATVNEFGSEILQTCVNLFKQIKTQKHDFNVPMDLDEIQIEKLIKLKPKPIIIEVTDVNDNDLAKEDGKTAKEALDFLRGILGSLSEKDKFEFMQYCNFELLKPVPIENLKLYELKTSGFPGNADFSYKLNELK